MFNWTILTFLSMFNYYVVTTSSSPVIWNIFNKIHWNNDVCMSKVCISISCFKMAASQNITKRFQGIDIKYDSVNVLLIRHYVKKTQIVELNCNFCLKFFHLQFFNLTKINNFHKRYIYKLKPFRISWVTKIYNILLFIQDWN